ncbi:MAG: hypothetical protein KatS3mg053_0239 [Candidatus Roseilinea sp.]|nr:MAG: hypothetical protein KatS3mg053_0239 [Candidatus Roseilinea sp.]
MDGHPLGGHGVPGSGAMGSVAFGCAYYQLHNGGADPVTLDLRVVVDTL